MIISLIKLFQHLWNSLFIVDSLVFLLQFLQVELFIYVVLVDALCECKAVHELALNLKRLKQYLILFVLDNLDFLRHDDVTVLIDDLVNNRVIFTQVKHQLRLVFQVGQINTTDGEVIDQLLAANPLRLGNHKIRGLDLALFRQVGLIFLL